MGGDKNLNHHHINGCLWHWLVEWQQALLYIPPRVRIAIDLATCGVHEKKHQPWWHHLELPSPSYRRQKKERCSVAKRQFVWWTSANIFSAVTSRPPPHSLHRLKYSSCSIVVLSQRVQLQFFFGQAGNSICWFFRLQRNEKLRHKMCFVCAHTNMDVGCNIHPTERCGVCVSAIASGSPCAIFAKYVLYDCYSSLQCSGTCCLWNQSSCEGGSFSRQNRWCKLKGEGRLGAHLWPIIATVKHWPIPRAFSVCVRHR